MPDTFRSYGQLLDLNQDELNRMEREAEERWQSANSADEAAKRSLDSAGGEAAALAARSGYANDASYFGSYGDYVKSRDSASAQWKAYRTAQQTSQKAARGGFESAARAGKTWKAAGDDENWGALEASQKARVSTAAGTYRPPAQAPNHTNPQAGWDNQAFNRDVSAAGAEVQRLEQAVRGLSPGPGRTAAEKQLAEARRRLQELQAKGDAALAAQRAGQTPTHHGYGNANPQYNQPGYAQQGTQATGSWKPPEE